MRLILGIDPGLNATGWGIIKSEGDLIGFIAAGTIKSSGEGIAERLHSINTGLVRIIDAYKPSEAAVEETFVNKNALSSLKLGHARGAIMLTLSLAGLSVEEYASTKVKKSLVGVGRAEKHQMEVMIKHILPGCSFDSSDAADALAVAVCHANYSQTIRKFGT